MFDTLLNDVRYAVRTLAARPGFTATVLLTLALAIGANTLVFSLIDGIYLKPLPYRDDAALIDLEQPLRENRGRCAPASSIPDYLDRREESSSSPTARSTPNASVNLAIDGAPERLHAHARDALAVLDARRRRGARPHVHRRGRPQAGRQGRRARPCAVAQPLQRAIPAIVGRELRLNGETYRVIGVMPAGFMFPDRDTALYVPFAFTEKQKNDHERGHEFSDSVARLAPGATSRGQGRNAIRSSHATPIASARSGADGAGFRAFMSSRRASRSTCSRCAACSRAITPTCCSCCRARSRWSC